MFQDREAATIPGVDAKRSKISKTAHTNEENRRSGRR